MAESAIPLKQKRDSRTVAHSEVAPTSPRRTRKDMSRISAQEYLILHRMKCIDRGQGCHAAVSRIGRSYDELHQNFSPAQTRRHIRRLRELGMIHFAGQTPDGRNVYLFPERTYQREDVPIDLGRPVEHLQSLPSGASWSTEKAVQILKLSDSGESPSRITLLDGYPVNRQILKSHSETTIRRAIGRLKAIYPTFTTIKSPTALLRYFINLEIQDQKKRQAAAAAAAPAVKQPAGPRLPEEVEKRILALLRDGRPAEANRLAADWEAGVHAGEQPSPESAPAKVAAQPAKTLAEVVEHYLSLKTGSAAQSPGVYYRQKAASLIRLLGALQVHELTSAELKLYQRKRRTDHVSDKTIREELKVLRQALELGASAGLVPSGIVDALGMPKGRAGPRREARSREDVTPCR